MLDSHNHLIKLMKLPLMTGFYTLVLTLGLAVGVILQPGGAELFTYAYDHWIPLVSASFAMSVIQGVFVYVNSFYSGELLALGGNSGVIPYDVSQSPGECSRHATRVACYIC
jgi:delta14-sterol reductase